MRRLVVAVAALFLAAGVVPGAAAKEASVAQKLAAIDAMMETRARAEMTRDRDGFARTIDPEAPAAFRNAQLASFDNQGALKIEGLDYRLNVEFGGNLTRGADPSEYGDAEVFVPQTLRYTRLPFDGDQAWIDDMWFTYVERDGRWYVAGNDDLVDVGLEPTVSMWDRAPVVVVQSAHVALIAHPADKGRAEALLGLAEQALTTLTQRWELPWTGTLVGFLPESPAELTDLIQASVDVTKYVAFVSYGVDPETYRSTAPRLFVQDENLTQYPVAAQVETLLHEFVHAAGARYASSFTPAWVHEGVADWIALGPSGAFRRGRASGDVAPRDDQFGAGSQSQIVQAYADSRSLIAALARIAGPQAPYQLFEALGKEPIRTGSRGYVVDQSLITLGLNGVADLEAKWRDGR